MASFSLRWNSTYFACMRSEQRLNQIEPVIAEVLQKVDRLVDGQGLILNEVAKIKGIEAEVAKLGGIEEEVAKLRALKGNFNVLKLKLPKFQTSRKK